MNEMFDEVGLIYQSYYSMITMMMYKGETEARHYLHQNMLSNDKK